MEERVKPLPRRFRVSGYSALNHKIISRVKPLTSDTADLVIVSESAEAHSPHTTIRQRGNTFGERITNAVLDTFACGYHEVVVIGNDCPTITTADISAAFDALANGATYTAAPASDGGAFLVGASCERFDRDAFNALPWKTDTLFTAFAKLPNAATLTIQRDDFDDWMTVRASQALARLLEESSSRLSYTLPSRPVPESSRIKALTRMYLPAPPTI